MKNNHIFPRVYYFTQLYLTRYHQKGEDIAFSKVISNYSLYLLYVAILSALKELIYFTVIESWNNLEL